MINLQATSINRAPAEGSALDELGLNASQQTEEKSDKNQFLELMIAQLENQNPLEPQEGGEFLAQLAQFSMVDGIERLNENTETMGLSIRSSQALEAANLVGRTVSVEADRFQSNGDVRGSVAIVGATSNVRVEITSLAGEPVKQINLGEKPKGDAEFSWDGTDDAGNPMPHGLYKVQAFSKTIDGEEQLSTEISMNVDSVTLGQAGAVELNVTGFGVLSIDDVRQIR